MPCCITPLERQRELDYSVCEELRSRSTCTTAVQDLAQDTRIVAHSILRAALKMSNQINGHDSDEATVDLCSLSELMHVSPEILLAR